jgi:hypothetical protein
MKTFAESVGHMNVGVVADESDEDYNVSNSDSSDDDSDLLMRAMVLAKMMPSS